MPGRWPQGCGAGDPAAWPCGLAGRGCAASERCEGIARGVALAAVTPACHGHVRPEPPDQRGEWSAGSSPMPRIVVCSQPGPLPQWQMSLQWAWVGMRSSVMPRPRPGALLQAQRESSPLAQRLVMPLFVGARLRANKPVSTGLPDQPGPVDCDADLPGQGRHNPSGLPSRGQRCRAQRIFERSWMLGPATMNLP